MFFIKYLSIFIILSLAHNLQQSEHKYPTTPPIRRYCTLWNIWF